MVPRSSFLLDLFLLFKGLHGSEVFEGRVGGTAEGVADEKQDSGEKVNDFTNFILVFYRRWGRGASVRWCSTGENSRSEN